MALSSVHQHNPDCDIWVHEYFTPSWFCLPNNQPALTVIRPGDTTRDVLEMICKVKAASMTWRGVKCLQPWALSVEPHSDFSRMPVFRLRCVGGSVVCEMKHMSYNWNIHASTTQEKFLQLELNLAWCRERKADCFLPFLLGPLCMSFWSVFIPWLCLCCLFPPTQPSSTGDQAVCRTLLLSPSAPQHPGPHPASFHWMPHCLVLQLPCPHPTTLVQIFLFPDAVPPSPSLLLPPLRSAWGRRAWREQQQQEKVPVFVVRTAESGWPRVGGRREEGRKLSSAFRGSGRKTTWISFQDILSETFGH